MKALVSHPVLQHSHQLAWALHERNLLRQFCSGVPVLSSDEPQSYWMPANIKSHLQVVPVPASLRSHPLFFQVILRLGNRLPAPWLGDAFDHRIFHAYDLWYSRQLSRLGGDVVVAYENSAYHTFQMAKRLGMRCVLDAASLHHTAGTCAGVDMSTPFRAEINRRKDKEVALADLVITCSPLAAESYAAAGVSMTKLRPILLGASVPHVKPSAVAEPDYDGLHYVYAGTLSYRKSVDIMLSVFRRLHAEGERVKLTLIGGVSDPRLLDDIADTPNAYYHPGVAQSVLFEKLAAADCLLLPSRFDSFGMVVAEAMACGIPAVVSSQVGAKALIERFPAAGWIVEPNANSLYECLRSQLSNPSAVRAARITALQASANFTWSAYRASVGALFEEFLS